MAADPRYLAAHRKLRKELLRQAIGQWCPYWRIYSGCPGLMLEGQPLDLAHDDATGGYLGLAHSSCNRAAGAAMGNRLRGWRRHSVIFPRWGRSS
jgi:sRNA-binding protein